MGMTKEVDRDDVYSNYSDKKIIDGKFLELNKEKVIAYVKANDVSVEKMFSNRLVCYLSPRYKQLSDLLFVEEETLRNFYRLSHSYAKKVISKVSDYLDINKEYIIEYCNGNEDAINKSDYFKKTKHSNASDDLPKKSKSETSEKKEEEETNFKKFSIDGSELTVIDLLDIPEYKERIGEFVKVYDMSFEDIGFSTRSSNCLYRKGYSSLSEVIFLSKETLSKISNMGAGSVNEVKKIVYDYFVSNQEKIIAYCRGDEIEFSIFEMIRMSKYKNKILDFVKQNDKSIDALGLKKRSFNGLHNEGYENLSDIIFETSYSLKEIRSLGQSSIEEINRVINDYLTKYEGQIIAYCKGDLSSILSIDVIKEKILKVFSEIGFTGLHYAEIVDALDFPSGVDEKNIKRAIGMLISEGQLEYVDYRCYRVYKSFETFLENDAVLDERTHRSIIKKLSGETLQAIADSEKISRERARQIIKKGLIKVRNQYSSETGLNLFDEDYYSYFYTTYDIDRRDCIKWLGISESTYYYLMMVNSKKGSRSLKEAIEDFELDVGFKMKISNYLNRNKIYVDGRWVEKKIGDLEDIVLLKYCKDEMSFSDFGEVYNSFLNSYDIPRSSVLYYSEDNIRTRANRLAESRCVLWKQSQMLRYYDIDGQDYTELFDEIRLEGYKNTEISTLKIFRDNKELMARYDIRDQYELHNLLRKTINPQNYNDMSFGRMPNILFGEFDLNATIHSIILENAPISSDDLVDLIYEEYGYDKATILATYLPPFRAYCHDGIYEASNKEMPEEHLILLKDVLTEDFYFINEVKDIYSQVVKDADIETINLYNLKKIGFAVYSQYIIQNHSSLEKYFEHILTENDTVDITEYRHKYCYVPNWSSKIVELKNKYTIIEFEPNQFIQYRKLESVGVTKKTLKEFCDTVYDYIDDKVYFSGTSLRLSGFKSELYDLGFLDWFYASILSVDDRFSYNNMFGTIILQKGTNPISVKSFLRDYVEKSGGIDIYDLMSSLENDYGCVIKDRNRFLSRIYTCDLYYDKILQRIYLNEDVYFSELDNEQGAL